MNEIRLKKSIFQALKLIVLSGAFVAIGIFIISDKGQSHWIGWMNLVFFGSAFILGLFQLFDRRDQLVANEHMLFDRANLNEPIAWASVAKIKFRKTGFVISKQAFAIVELKSFSGENLRFKLKKRRFAKKADRDPFVFTISLTPLEGNTHKTFETLSRFHREAENLSKQ